MDASYDKLVVRIKPQLYLSQQSFLGVFSTIFCLLSYSLCKRWVRLR